MKILSTNPEILNKSKIQKFKRRLKNTINIHFQPLSFRTRSGIYAGKRIMTRSSAWILNQVQDDSGASFGYLKFGIYLLFGICYLEFRAERNMS